MKNSDSLCWYCKKAMCNPDHTCCWTRFCQPVPNWTAEEGIAVTTVDEDRKLRTEHSYNVLRCPEFERDTEWVDYSEFIKHLCVTLNVRKTYYYRAPLKYYQQYLTKTQEEPIEWVTIEVNKHQQKRDKKKKELKVLKEKEAHEPIIKAERIQKTAVKDTVLGSMLQA